MASSAHVTPAAWRGAQNPARETDAARLELFDRSPAKAVARLARLAALVAIATAVSFALPKEAVAQDGSDENVAKQLANPIAALISVPFQFNWDRDVGPTRDGRKFFLNFQPVVPFRINEDWNVISRTVVPIVDQHVPLLGDGSQSGVGDVTQSLFFSPSRPTGSGVIWGIGPAILIPSDTDYISAKKWGLGPTAVALRQQGPWTYGVLTNHIWSVAGSGAQAISSTFIQPFLSFTTKDAWTFTLQTESTYDWRNSQWNVPVNAQVAKLVKFGALPVNLGAGVRYYADSPTTGAHGWGARLVVTFVFPKK